MTDRARIAVHLALVAALVGCAPVQAQESRAQAGSGPAPPTSLIVGRWMHEGNIRGVPCPEDDICLNVIGDIRLGDVRTLAGPSVPILLTATFEFHAPPAEGYDWVLLVRPSASRHGRFDGISVGGVRRGGRVCLLRETLVRFGIAIPAGARSRGEYACFRGRNQIFTID